ncbi:M1 family metallopeptidase [Leuconostocaceae bacterium ESL0723]|nr:M1 family metallopeptidase [Leuconostocaceae bacterium ESL0723]
MTAIARFYEAFKPKHYDLYLDISRQDKTIKGHTKIFGEAQSETVALHQHDLKIEELLVDGEKVPFEVENAEDAVRFPVGKTGEITIDVTYSAPLTDNMNGIYPSYFKVDGVEKQLVSTQFETYFARQAFPSIDEPEAKATFSLALKFDEQPGETAIANMPEDHVTDGVRYFETTVKMSTYLVAFTFGEMQNKQTETQSGVKVGVFATKAHPDTDLDFALDIAKRSIEFYEDYYQTEYPLPHSWQVALPDFSAGAMENWGMVTYREAYLLLDPKNTALGVKQVVATVIAHELAHQWFGDLVTMKWWDELWLNESFANMMEYVAVDALEPDWHIWETFNASDVQAALKRDAIEGVQSVHVAVNHPEEIDALFDPAIVYAKGARLLVMVRAFIGDDALRRGLKAYFEKMRYGNASGDDLWDALGHAAGQDLTSMMKTWLQQPGYPVVSAKVENGHLVLSQHQFNIGPAAKADRRWQIPLNSNIPDAPKVMKEASVDLGDYQELADKTEGPIRLNVGNAAHFIVHYDETLAKAIEADLANLDPISKAQQLQDRLLLAQAGQGRYADLLPLLTSFANSKSALVNDLVYQAIGQLKFFVSAGSPEEDQLRQLVQSLTGQQLARLGWLQTDSDSNDDRLIRPLILSAAVYGRAPEALEAAHDLFEKYRDDLTKLPAEARPAVLTNEIENYNSQATFDLLLNLYQNTATASLKSDIQAALTTTPDAKQVNQAISDFQTATVIKPQDLRRWFEGYLRNPVGQQAAWDWIRDQWSWLEEKLGGDMEFSSYVTVISRVFHTAERLNEFEAFFNPKIEQPGLTREIQMDRDIIASRVQVIADQQESLFKALEAH